jgi:hypothetical protein
MKIGENLRNALFEVIDSQINANEPQNDTTNHNLFVVNIDLVRLF